MDINVRTIMENIGCSQNQAKIALMACNNDLSKAVNSFIYLVNNIYVIKGKMIDTKTCGCLFNIAVDIKERKIVRVNTVLTRRYDLVNINVKDSWYLFDKALINIKQNEDIENSNNIELNNLVWNLAQPDKMKRLCSHIKNRRNIDFNLQMRKYLKNSEFANVMKINITFEKVLLKEEIFCNENLQAQLNQDRRDKGINQKHIEMDVKLTEIGESKNKIKAKYLKANDTVMADVIDKRDVAKYITKLLGGLKKDKHVPLYAIVNNIEMSGEYLVVKLRFSPGITGTTKLKTNEKVILMNKKKNILGRKIFKFLLDIKDNFVYNH
ncbi:hypothetical protein ACFL4A_03035 [bacterium]